LPLQGSKPDRPVRSLVTILAELSRIPTVQQPLVNKLHGVRKYWVTKDRPQAIKNKNKNSFIDNECVYDICMNCSLSTTGYLNRAVFLLFNSKTASCRLPFSAEVTYIILFGIASGLALVHQASDQKVPRVKRQGLAA
jgi:hypothetical protein